MRHERIRSEVIKPGIVNGTIMRLGRGESCFSLQTRSRAYSTSHRFLIVVSTFREWLADESRDTFYESDIGSFVRIRKGSSQDIYRVQFTWLSSGNDQVHGHKETISIPCEKIDEILGSEAGTEIVCLSTERSQKPSLDFSKSAGTIRRICECRKTQRAFSKAIRDILMSKAGGGYTYLPDSPRNSFFFRTDGYCGGLIQHESIRKTPIGEIPYVYYGVHT